MEAKYRTSLGYRAVNRISWRGREGEREYEPQELLDKGFSWMEAKYRTSHGYRAVNRVFVEREGRRESMSLGNFRTKTLTGWKPNIEPALATGP